MTTSKPSGHCIFFTGLSGSGKTTLANALAERLSARGRTLTLLDGDVIRTHLSSELGYTKADRDLNIRRIGFVAAEVVRHGGVAICAAIAPYDAARQALRAMVAAQGHFVLIHVATPLSVCESRDAKGLYAQARAGTLPAFTGVSDPYQRPTDAELLIDTAAQTVQQSVDELTSFLRREYLLG